MNIMFIEYMKRKCFGGKNKFSRTIDAVLFRLLIFLAIYFVVPESDYRLFVSVLFTAAMCFILHLISKARVARFTTKELKRIRTELQRDALLLMPDEQISKLIGDNSTFIRKIKAITISDIVPCIVLGYKKIFAVVPFEHEVIAFVKRNNCEVELLDTKTLEKDIVISEKQIEGYVESIQRSTRRGKTRLRTDLLNIKTGKYLLLGGVILILSFFVRIPLYYRLLSNICIIIASLTFIKKRVFPIGNP